MRTLIPGRDFVPVEWDFLQCKQNEFNEKSEQVENLIQFSESLQNRVRQMIEIGDENHSRAIRIFTVTTLIFVPLTFVSGFFGMNTNDIRDIDANQTLYWMISIPVTFVTLSIAFIYGYKADDLSDWFHNKFHRTRLDRSKMAVKLPKMSTEVLSLVELGREKGKPQPAAKGDRTARGRWSSSKTSIRDRVRQRKSQGPKRGDTFDV
ncbi:hypothetical protein VTJ04DRAFT_8728 [Mycothermus thermophilus]|uniref:uncharacterized protein n=1 Tax=Humicola insolens TaxID=85995 RepID=UPI0037429BE2